MSNDIIKRGRQRKNPFEQIPRSLLQNTDLSLEAIGLLCNLLSYSDDWKLHKTELYKRFSKNKRSSIERIWAELIEHGYIIQFRKRDGKRYVFTYLFDEEPYTLESIQENIKEYQKAGYKLYRKDVDMNDKKLTIYDFCPHLIRVKQDNEIWDVDFQHLNKSHNNNVSWDVDFEHPKLSSPKSTSNIYLNKYIDDDEYINNARTQNKPATENSQDKDVLFDMIMEQDKKLNGIAMYLYKAKLNYDIVRDIIIGLYHKPHLAEPQLVQNQLNWCVEKSKTESIANYPTYFLNGLERRYDGFKAIRNNELAGNGEIPQFEPFKVPEFDWDRFRE